jgi:citrate synthase
MIKNRYLTAREAASELGVSLDTLYAYVSRGLIRSEAGDGQKRSRWYSLEDVQRLKKHKGEYRHPDKVAAGAMQAGTLVMVSSNTRPTR